MLQLLATRGDCSKQRLRLTSPAHHAADLQKCRCIGIAKDSCRRSKTAQIVWPVLYEIVVVHGDWVALSALSSCFHHIISSFLQLFPTFIMLVDMLHFLESALVMPNVIVLATDDLRPRRNHGCTAITYKFRPKPTNGDVSERARIDEQKLCRITTMFRAAHWSHDMQKMEHRITARLRSVSAAVHDCASAE